MREPRIPLILTALKVFKYPLKTTDVQTIVMPVNARILTIQTQKFADRIPYEVPCIWALVDANNTHHITRTFEIYRTGVTVNPNSAYVGTYQLDGGKLVFHCFERPND